MIFDIEKYTGKNDRVIKTLVLIIFILIFFGTIISFCMIKGQIQASEKIVIEVCKQLAYTIQTRISNDLQTLNIINSLVDNDTSHFNSKTLINYLENNEKQAVFENFYYIPLDKNTVITPRNNSEKEIDSIKDSPCFDKSKNGATCFYKIKIHNSEFLNARKNIYTVPVYSKNKIVAVLAATTFLDGYKELLEINNFDGKWFGSIIKDNGDYILRGESQFVEEYQNIFQQNMKYINTNQTKLLENFKSKKSGIFWQIRNGQLWMTAYNPINYKNWIVIIAAPANILATNVLNIMLLTIATMLSIFFVLYRIVKRVGYLQKQSYNKIFKIAFIDEVTNGPNYSKFTVDMKSTIDNSTDDDNFALVLIGISKFKVINEAYGFEKANIILKDIFNLIKETLPEGTLIARISSSNYIFLLKYTDKKAINNAIKQVYKAIRQYDFAKIFPAKEEACDVMGITKLAPKFGVYVIEDKSVPIYHMFNRIQLAKRLIDNSLSTHVSYYDDELREQLLKEKEIEDDMYTALEQGQFIMYLQPKYDIKTMKVAGSEALVRWIHPTKGFLPPADFIPLFEKNGFVINVDKYIWEEACKTIRRWIDTGYTPVPISVNVSRLHLNSDHFIVDLKNLVSKYHISPKYIELEITESVGYEYFDRFLKTLEKLKNYGFKIAMDDFGTGYSSLNALRQIPCNTLKLDRGFINDSFNSEQGKIIVQHILAMAKNLSLTTVCEGIENIEQAKFLTEAGCDIAQGYLYAKPMTITEFDHIAFNNQPLEIDGLTN